MTEATPASDIAVVIVSYNSGRYLQQCLESVAAQTLPAQRVIVVDNASTDDSTDICARFPFVELHRAGGNLGFARGNNVAVEMAPDCRWIALLNPDAFAAPDWLQKLSEAARLHADVDVFACRLISAGNHAVLDGAGDAYGTSGSAWPRYQGAPVGVDGEEPYEVFGGCGAAVMYRREAYVAVGGFDESYFCYHEDVDLAFRLRLRGHRCLYLPHAAAYHVGSGITGGTASDFSIYHVHRNVVWTFVKNMPGRYFWFCLPRHFLMNLVSLLLFAARGHLRVIARAKWHALLGLPAAWRQRQRVQRERRTSPEEAMVHIEKIRILRSIFRRIGRRLAPQAD